MAGPSWIHPVGLVGRHGGGWDEGAWGGTGSEQWQVLAFPQEASVVHPEFIGHGLDHFAAAVGRCVELEDFLNTYDNWRYNRQRDACLIMEPKGYVRMYVRT